MLSTVDDVRHHVEFKREARELREDVAIRMLDALTTGAPADYPALLRAATFITPPAIVYHTAPCPARSSILTAGLAVSQPGEDGSWASLEEAACEMLAAQPPGVYVCGEPDARGVWAHWLNWDVWKIVRGEMSWCHDELNPGCWSLQEPVPAFAVRLYGTYTLPTVR